MTEVFEFSGQPPVRRIYNFNKKSSTKKKKKKRNLLLEWLIMDILVWSSVYFMLMKIIFEAVNRFSNKFNYHVEF